MRCETRFRRTLLPRTLLLCGLFTFAVGTATEAQAQIDLGTWRAGEVWVQLPGPFTYAVDPLTPLPPGLALRFDTPPWFPPSVPAGIIGIATAPSATPYTFNLLRDGVPVQHTIKIPLLTHQDNWSLPDAFVNVPFSYQLTPRNAAGPVTWAANGPLPPGLSLNASGHISGTPTQSGSYNINFSLNDTVDTVYAGVNLNVYDVQITTPGTLPNATQGSAYETTILAAGGAGGHTFASTSLPNGFSLSQSGVLSGTAGGPGKYSFDITTTDANSVSSAKRMSLTVAGLPRVLPRVNPYGGFLTDCSFFVSCTSGVSVDSGGVAPFTWSSTGLPPGMSLRSGEGMTSWWITPGDVEIAGIPTQLGMFNVQLTVTDAEGAQATNTFPLFVRPLYLWNGMPNGTYVQPYSHAFYLMGGQQPYSVSLVGGGFPVGLTLSSGAFNVTGTPQEMGGFTATLLFSDSGGGQLRVNQYPNIGSATSTIYIQHNGDLGTLTAGFSYGNQLQACCVPSYVWSISSGSLPPGLSFTSSGLLSGVIPSGTTGTYTFMVRVEDAANAANFAVRQFKAVVTPMSSPTSFTLPYGNVGVPYNFGLGSTGNVGAVAWALEPNQYLPPGLVLTGTGVISGTPTAPGFLNFSVRATDTVGNYMIRSFGISIYPAGGNPPLNLPLSSTFTQLIGPFAVQLAATGGTPPYSYAWSPGAVPIPGMRVQSGAPLPTSFPGSTGGGMIGVLTTPAEYSSSIRVTDSLGAIFDKAITVRVPPLHLTSQGTIGKATVGTPYSFTLQPYGGTSHTWAARNLPSGLSIDSSGQILGTPTVAGTFFPTITLGDLASGDSVNIGITLTVDPFAITTGGVLPTGVVGTAYNHAFSAPGCPGPCTWSVLTVGGLTLSSAGVLSGTPTGTSNSIFTVTVTDTGTNVTVSKTFSLRIVSASPQPLVINTATLSDTTVGNSVATALFFQGGTAPYTVLLQSGNLPPGVSLQFPGESLGASLGPGFTYLAGRPMQTGIYSFTLAVTDFAGTTVTRAFVWNISALSNQYFNLPLGGTTLRYGAPYTQPLLMIGGTGLYSWSSGGMPPGLTLHPATGVVSGTPTNTGSFTVPVMATDGSAVLTANISFLISGPTATVINFSLGTNLGPTVYGSGINFSVIPSGGTAPYTITALTPLPAGTALVPLTTAVAGSLSLIGVATTPGVHTFTLRAQDAAGNIGVRTFNWTVAPFAVSGGTNLNDASVGVPYSQAILMLGTAPTWTVPSTTVLPPGLNVSAGGVISGTPTAPGNYSFQLSASAGGVIVTFNFTLRVSDVALTDTTLPPATFGVAYTHALTATGGGALSFSANGLPSGLTMSADGVISGVPDAVGSFTIQVTITGGAVNLQRRLTLFVMFENPGVLDIPMATTLLVDASVGQAMSLTLTANGGTPPYTFSVAAGSTLPPGLALVSGAALPPTAIPGSTLLSGIPTAAGAYQFDLIVGDADNGQTRRTYLLTVSSLTIAANPPNATTGTAYSFRLTAVGGTPPYTFDKAPVGLTQDMLPAGITLSADGLLSGIPTSTGIFRFFARIQDSAGKTLSRQVNLNVFSPTNLQVSNTNPPDASVGRGRFAQTLSAFTVAGPTFFTWSVVGGALPPGMALFTDAEFQDLGFGQTIVAGQPTTPGTYTYTLRATDTANPSRTADHAFTMRVAPMQAVSPDVPLYGAPELPAGHVGDAYSATIRMAGGTPPYTFSVSPFIPLPPGLALSSTGVLSGTPTASGAYTIAPIVTDANGYTLASNLLLIVSAPGTPSPLVPRPQIGIDTPSVNTPYAFPLNLLVRGGVHPLTWAVDAGSTLPPGLTLVGGQNGVPAFLAGVVTTSGEYEFTLIATDAQGQTLTAELGAFVSDLVLGAIPASAGTVGVPYSLALGPAGGTPPHMFQVDPTFDLPPGLTVSGGSLTGTPLSSGYFFVVLWMFDQNDNAAVRLLQITIDHPVAGDAPALSIAPNPVNIYYEQGSPSPDPVPVSINLSSGSAPFSLDLAGAPWASPSTTGGTGSSVVALTVDPSGLSTGTYIGFLAAAASASVNGSAIAPVVLTVAVAPPCSYEVNPSAGTIAPNGGAGSFGVATGGSCAWAAVASDPAWITITSGAAGTGGGVVNYTVSANPGVDARTATIAVSSAVYSITQFGSGCAFTIAPSYLSVGALGGAALIAVNASASSCGWTASGLGATPPAGTGSGSVLVTIPANLDPAPRQLTATIAGQTLTVEQAGAACTVGLSGSNAAYGSGGGDGSVTVTTPAGCAYNTAGGPNWITITSGGSGVGSAMLLYSVLPNPTTFARTGTLTIGGQPFQITQQPLACSVTLDTTALGSPYGPASGTGSIGVTTNGTNCTWTASSDALWAFVSPPSGIGNGAVVVNVGSNTGSTTQRPAILTVGGSTINISQAGTTCTFTLQSPAASAPGGGGAGSVGVVAPAVCSWTAQSNDGWLTGSPAGGSGTASVGFVAQPNPNATPRIGTLTIAGLAFTVNQAAAPCSYTLSAPGIAVASEGTIGNFSFTASAASCNPDVRSFAGWLHAAATFDGTSGTVAYTVDTNPSGFSRMATIQVGSQAFTVTQLGSACAFSLNSYGRLFDRNGGVNSSLLGSPSAVGCTPDVGTTQPSFIVLGTLTGPLGNIFTLTYDVLPFPIPVSPWIRRGAITFGGQIFAVKQSSW